MMRTGFLMGVVLLVAGCRADAGEKVLVKLADKKYSAVAGPDCRMKPMNVTASARYATGPLSG